MFTDRIGCLPFSVSGGLKIPAPGGLKASGYRLCYLKASGYRLCHRVCIAAMLVAAPGCSSAPEAPQAPATVRVLSSNGVRAVIEALQPEIERAVGHALSIEFSTAASLKTRIEAGRSTSPF